MDIAGPGRREQNKRRTHRALVEAAARLFREKGFEATTVRDIARAACVGERTFFRYFPSKESLILQQVRDIIPVLEEGIRNRPAAEPPLQALRETVLELADRQGPSAAILLAGPEPLRPDLHSRGEQFLLVDLEEAVASAFLHRFTSAGADPDDLDLRLRTAVLARAGVGALRVVRLVCTRLPESECNSTVVTDLVRRAFAALER